MTRKRTFPVPRPFLKWAGGKGQLAEQLIELRPTSFGAYHEPFVGGGALFFAMHRRGLLEGPQVHLSDVSRELTDTFCMVRDDVEGVITALQPHRYDREYYYCVRAQEPRQLDPAARAARMIFLNRAGFNGLYRVNSKGQFNVPFGRYTNPTLCDAENLRACAAALRGVQIHCEPFERVIDRAGKCDFVYFDPPYVPASRTANFVAYADDGFHSGDHERLAGVFELLARQGVRVMLSNSDTEWVKDRYWEHKIVAMRARRNVNSRADRRGQVSELVILNYALATA